MSSTSSKTLIRTGFSLATRLLTPAGERSILQTSPRSLNIIGPKLFPSLYPQQHLESNAQCSRHFPVNDADDTLKKLNFEGILYPGGLPCLPMFLPDGNIPFLYAQCENDADDTLKKKLTSEGFLYPGGLPYAPMFLPDGNDSTERAMLLRPTRKTSNPSNKKRKRKPVYYYIRNSTKARRGRISRRVVRRTLKKKNQVPVKEQFKQIVSGDHFKQYFYRIMRKKKEQVHLRDRYKQMVDLMF